MYKDYSSVGLLVSTTQEDIKGLISNYEPGMNPMLLQGGKLARVASTVVIEGETLSIYADLDKDISEFSVSLFLANSEIQELWHRRALFAETVIKGWAGLTGDHLCSVEEYYSGLDKSPKDDGYDFKKFGFHYTPCLSHGLVPPAYYVYNDDTLAFEGTYDPIRDTGKNYTNSFIVEGGGSKLYKVSENLVFRDTFPIIYHEDEETVASYGALEEILRKREEYYPEPEFVVSEEEYREAQELYYEEPFQHFLTKDFT